MMIGLMVTNKLDCFGDAFKKSGSILIRFRVAMQLFHLDGYIARFCRRVIAKFSFRSFFLLFCNNFAYPFLCRREPASVSCA